MSRPEKLAKTMARALEGLALDQRLAESRAMAVWPEVVGTVNAGKTRPLYVNRGVLVVAVSSSAWANQLNLLKGRLLAGIEERCGPGIILDLRWKVGQMPSDPDGQAAPPVAERPAWPAEPATPLTEAEGQAIARHVEAIANPRLAARYERLLIAQVRRRQRQAALGWQPCLDCGVLCDPAGTALCPTCQRTSGAP